LSREELEEFATDPKWVKIRWVLFIIFIVGWVAMLVIAIIIVVITPKCPPSPELKWYSEGVAYNVDIERFKDSNGDGKGDIAGLSEKLDHFKDLSVKSIWVDVLNDTNLTMPASLLGSMEEFMDLASSFKKGGVRVVIPIDLASGGIDTSDMDALNGLVRTWADAGAEGFVLSPPAGLSSVQFVNISLSLQELLDEEYNKRDDRDRVIITASVVNVTYAKNVRAALYNPTPDPCTGEACQMEIMENVMNVSMEVPVSDEATPWKILSFERTFAFPNVKLVYKMTLPGTPNVQGGDEIGLVKDGYMKWDDSKTGGFTDDETFSYPANHMAVDSVLAHSSVGYEGESLYSLFQDLAKARADEPSLKWGAFVAHDFQAEGVESYRREAEGFAPVVVAFNNGADGAAGSLSFIKTTTNKKGKETVHNYSRAEILVASGVDVEVGEEIDSDAVYLPPGGAVVARLINPDAKKWLI